MKIINLPRAKGKTTRLLYASEFQEIPILCVNDRYKEYLIDAAEELGLKIPEPISVTEVVSNRLRGNNIGDNGVLVDEAPMVLQSLLNSFGLKGEVKAITLTEKE